MVRPPQVLQDEQSRLWKSFLEQIPGDDLYSEESEEAEKIFHEEIKRWFYEHGSEELKLYMEYRRWIGDEGELCDGNGVPLLTDSNYCLSWIQEWDVNDEGYCLYPDTKDLIINTDDNPIKNPVLDERVLALYNVEG